MWVLGRGSVAGGGSGGKKVGVGEEQRTREEDKLWKELCSLSTSV